MDSPWTLTAPDGATIYGVANSSGQADTAVFIVHGLTGHMYEYQHKRAADHFAPRFDVYRFNLYDGREGARALVDCTIATHAADLQTVLARFAGRYRRVFLIGHSYGGPTIMRANPGGITAVSLWDPSYDLRGVQEQFKKSYVADGAYYQVNWGTSYLIGRAMFEEAARMDAALCERLAREFSAPVQVVLAGEGHYAGKPHSYDSFNARNRRDIVYGTQHCFYEGASCDELLEKTARWFESFA